MKNLRKLPLAVLTSMLPILAMDASWAAPGELANAPLTATTGVEANIHLTIDDSSSMNWGMMLSNDMSTFIVASPAPDLDSTEDLVPIVGGQTRRYWHPADANPNLPGEIMPDAEFTTTSANWDDHFWIVRTNEVNTLYYDSNIDYKPWAGLDANGQPLFQNANPSAALINPNDPTQTTNLTERITYTSVDGCPAPSFPFFGFPFFGSSTCNQSLFLPTFYTWTDSNGNGRLDSSDSHTLVKIHPDTPTTQYPSGRTYAQEIQNFANWFQYYRKREYTAKAAIGAVINNASSVRMGLDLFNDGHVFDSASMRDPANKAALLNTFYSIESSGNTPAREALRRVGEMFRQSTTVNTIPPPILPQSDGGECQQNFNILMTDGFWTDSIFSPFNFPNSDLDGGPQDTDIHIGNGVFKGFDGNASQSADGGNYADNFSNTLADIAMHYYETDLRDLANRVPTSPGIDLAPHQHLVTYSVAFGVEGTLDTSISPTTDGFAWTDPNRQGFLAVDGRLRIDDLWHAAYNSRGQFLSARSPEQLENALNVAIDDIADRTATSSAVSVTSARLTTESVVYRSQYNTNRWTGTISALPIENLDLGILSDSELWDAATVLDQVTVTPQNRTILTYHNTADPNSPRDGIPFRWNSITNAMKADLRINPAGAIDNDTIAEARLDFLRGDRSNEGQGFNFRERGSRLGDIVNSGPVFVKEANLRWPDDSPFFPSGDNAYSEFATRISTDNPDTPANEARQGVIYVGANDGMVHGFRESDGKEILAYIPSNLFSDVKGEGLHYLTHGNYLHKFYNDLTPTISDVYIANNNATDWHTILIAGQRGGGRGYTALDITNPNNFSENNAANVVMWEFTNATDNDLGYTFSQPQVGVTNDGEWVAIFGNGYNHSGDGAAKLFIVKIAAGLDGTWSVSDYTKISTGEGAVDDLNGLGTPALADLDGNGTIDRAYAGDLKGNMWVFDLSSTLPSTWTQASSVSKLFTTVGNRPITSQPALSFHPTIGDNVNNAPNLMVAFGSGQLLVHGDLTATDAEYFYAVWDRGESNLTSTSLVAQTTQATTVNVAIDPANPDAGTTSVEARILTSNNVDYSTSRGWYINLPGSGERTVTNPIIRSNVVFFNTLIPASDVCAGSGSGFRFTVDLASGGAPSEPVIDINQDGVVDENDRQSGEAQAVIAAIKYDRALTDDTITERHLINQSELIAIQTAPDRKTGRISWQELLQQ